MIILPRLLDAQWIPLIVNHLWQSTIFALAAWLLTLVLKKNQARIRYWLWLLASVKFLLPFSLLIKAGEQLQPHSSLATMPGLSTAMDGFTEPFSGSVMAQPVTPTAVSAAAQSVAQTHSDVLPMVLLAIWACGALFLLARWGVRWLRIQRIVWASSPIAMACAVPVRFAPGHLEPGIFGIFRPVLLLPEGITERLNPAQLDAIMAHEICHVRRRDNLTAALHMLVEVVFWFYPLVWWIGAGLMKERERACDEAVVESHCEVLTYAEGILNVCKNYMEAPINCVSGVMGSDLKERIRRILSGSIAGELNLRRKLLLALAAVLAVAVPVTTGVIHNVHASAKTGIEGTWQGTLKFQQEVTRVVLKIAKTDAGGIKGTLYSVDQEGAAVSFPSLSASIEDRVQKYAIEMINSSYEGEMSTDHNTITGVWTQYGESLPLVLKRATPATEWAHPETSKPMAANADPSFEAATIKASNPNDTGRAFLAQGTRFGIVNTTALALLTTTFGVHAKQLENAPAWLESKKYNIEGTLDISGAPNVAQLIKMIEKLLADRMNLKFHKEQREMTAYVLEVAQDGPKLDKSDAGPNSMPGLFFSQPGVLNVRNATMTDFSKLMQQSVLDRPVLDRTGLQGRWNFTLKWTPDEAQSAKFVDILRNMPPASDSADAPPPLSTAIQQQIGLKFSSEKARVPVVVIDHIEKPALDLNETRISEKTAAFDQTESTPHPGTEAALRRHIEGLEKKQPVTEEIAPVLAAAVEGQRPQLEETFERYGALKSITFSGNENGNDVYHVEFEHATTTWTIGPLIDGKVYTLFFRPAINRDGNAPNPGFTDAIRRDLDLEGIFDGESGW